MAGFCQCFKLINFVSHLVPQTDMLSTKFRPWSNLHNKHGHFSDWGSDTQQARIVGAQAPISHRHICGPGFKV